MKILFHGSRIPFRICLGILSLSTILLWSCQNNIKTEYKQVSYQNLRYIRLGLNERDITEILGKPNKIGSTFTENNKKAKVYYYNINDGRQWAIVIDKDDGVICSGELDNRKGKLKK